MLYAFRAIAIDYDGTLTTRDRPGDDALAAIRALRAAGMTLLLVTGRILSELRGVFPEVGDTFDAVVAENGAVLWSEAGGFRNLAPPVSVELETALRARGVFPRRGEALLALDAVHDGAALEEIARLGLDCQLVRNRGALMILPAGVSKGTGLSEALGELGISHHNAIGIGDAENDHALLEACEIGVAVQNAIPSLRAHADLVLPEPDGVGVTRFLEGALRGDLPRVVPTRWRVAIGTRPDGSSVTLPGSNVNVLVAGASGSGKSYLAGLLAERLVRLGYSVCVFDPEGDHTSLGHLRGIVTLGGSEGIPPIGQLARLLKGRFGATVIDMSLITPEERATYTAHALTLLQQHRQTTGLPHWIFLDEAHASLGTDALRVDAFDPSQKGFCLVTYHPTELCQAALLEADILLLLPRSEMLAREILAKGGHRSSDDVERLVSLVRELERGEALMVTFGAEERAEVVRLGSRRSSHVRHWHKYVHGYLAPRHHFLFRDASGRTGRWAANLEDFHRELTLCPEGVLSHHLSNHDFSRWISEALQDESLAASVRLLEERECTTSLDTERVRDALMQEIERRYGDGGSANPSSSFPPPSSRTNDGAHTPNG